MNIKKLLYNRIRLPLVLAVSLSLSGGAFIQSPLPVYAEVDSTNAVPFAKAQTLCGGFEPGTLIMGTIAMHRNVVTDFFMDVAEGTVNESGQGSTYYRSDLAGGVWYDITNSSGLSEIYDGGRVVSRDELNDLFIRYYVDRNGVMTDILTGEMVNPVNIPDPYDFYNHPSFKPLTSAYDGLLKRQAEENPGPSQYYRNKIGLFYWSVNRHNRETNLQESRINNLFNLYKSLTGQKRYDEADKVMEVMRICDAKRRVEILRPLLVEVDPPPNLRGMDRDRELKPLMDSVGYKWRGNGRSFDQDREWMGDLLYGKPAKNLGILEIQLSGTGYIREHYDDVHFSNQDYAINTLGDVREAVNQDLIKYESLDITEGTDVRTRARKAAFDSLVSTTSQSALNDYIDITSILAGVVKNKSRELNKIVNNYIPEADRIIAADFRNGAGNLYKEGVNLGESKPALKARLSQQREEELEVHIAELQALLIEQKKRINASDGLDLFYKRLNDTDTWERSIKDDAFRSNALAALTSHREWLKLQAKAIVKENEDLQSKMNDLEKEREDLIRERDMALDDGNRQGAGRFNDLINEKDKQIADGLNDANGNLDNATGTGDKAKASQELGDGSLDGAIGRLVDAVMGQISDNAGGFTPDQARNTDLNITGDGQIESESESRAWEGNIVDAINNGTWDGTGMTDFVKQVTGFGDSEAEDPTANVPEYVEPAGSRQDLDGVGNDLGLSNPNSAGGAALDALSELGATDALNQINDALNDMGASDKDKKAVKDAIDGAGKIGGDLNEDALMAIIEEILGKPFDQLDSKGKIVAAVATAEFGKSFAPALTLGRKLMATCINEKNPYSFYTKDIAPSGKYTSITALSTAVGWRYEHTGLNHSLSNDAKCYNITVGSDIIIDEKEDKKRLCGKLEKGPGLKDGDVPYLNHRDIKVLFDATVEYVDNTSYGGCFSSSMENLKKKLIERFKKEI